MPTVFRTRAETTVRRAKALLEPDPPNLLVSTLAPTVVPFSSSDYQVLPRKRILIEQQPDNLLLTAMVAPFIPSADYVPVKRRVFVDTDPPDLLTTTLAVTAPVPFTPAQIENPPPKRSRVPYLPDGTSNLATATFVQPTPPPATSSQQPDNPPIRKRIVEQDPVNLLTNTLAAVIQNPFTSIDYSVVVKRRFVQVDDVANLLPLTQQLPFSAGSDTVLSKRKTIVPEDASNLLLTAAVTPFTSSEAQVLYKRKFVLHYDASSFPPVPTALPFTSSQIDNPPSKRSYAAYLSDNAFNLATATFVQPVPPPSSGDWTIATYPRRTVLYADINLLTATLNPIVPIMILVSDPVYTVSLRTGYGGKLPFTVKAKP